ncbi:hypothetical protein FS842_001225, partial [Serendipita sp. 407]
PVGDQARKLERTRPNRHVMIGEIGRHLQVEDVVRVLRRRDTMTIGIDETEIEIGTETVIGIGIETIGIGTGATERNTPLENIVGLHTHDGDRVHLVLLLIRTAITRGRVPQRTRTTIGVRNEGESMS